MSTVNHRYSSKTWSLDLSAQQSPLSRWTGRSALRQEQLRLALLGAEAGVAPVTWLAGDRPCFEALHQTVERYVHQGLSQPVLGPQSTFPGAISPSHTAVSTVPGPTLQPATLTQSELTQSKPNQPKPNQSKPNQPEPTQPERSLFFLEALGLLRHRLSYYPPDTQARQLQLSTLQLADLLAVLDQWQSETVALPGQAPAAVAPRRPRDTDFVVPAWGRVAASVLIATGAVGSGVYVINQQLVRSSASQIALESPTDTASEQADAFGAFPRSGGPPLTSQSSDPNFDQPFLPAPATSEEPGPESGLPPSVVFPGGSLDGPLPGAPLVLGPNEIPPNGMNGIPGNNLGNNSGLNASGRLGLEPGEGDRKSPATGPISGPISGQTSGQTSGRTDASSGATGSTIAQANSKAAEDQALVSPQQAPETSESTSTSTPEETARAAAIARPAPRATEPSAAAPDESATPQVAAAAPPAPQVTVAQPLPANAQSQAVQSYLEQNWKPPTSIRQPLQYRLQVSGEGKLTRLEPLSPTSLLYRKDANFPDLGETLGSSGGPGSTLLVTLSPNGTVKVVVEQQD